MLRVKAIKPAALEMVKSKCAGKASARQFASAVKLVLEGKARMVAAGMVEVASQSEAGKVYTLVQGAKVCNCKHGVDKPQLMCAHRIAACILHAITSPVPVKSYTKETALSELYN